MKVTLSVGLMLSLYCLVLLSPVTGQEKQRGKKKALAPPPPPSLPEPSGQRLKTLAPIDGSKKILVGGSINIDDLGTAAETIANREFDFIAPGNEFKQAGIHSEPGVWRWQKPDLWIERCANRNQLMRLHAPLSPQCSQWVEEDDRTAEELMQVLEEYVTAICKRYNDKLHVRWMDVVNETVTNKGEWFGPREGTGRWENPWPKIGYDETDPLRPPLYIKRAFELANEHAPNLKLMINQHSGMEQAMWRKVCATVVYLRKHKLRIDGIGWQAHVDAGWEKDPQNLKSLNNLIDWAHSNQLEFHVTENTVRVDKDNPDYEAQAATFAAIVRTLIEHRDQGVVTWNAWQMRESDTQRPELRGTMFDNEGNPKPAYFAVQKELQRLE